MINVSIKFAETTDAASGIGAFNVNLKAFLFQLITFIIVLWTLKRWVLPKLMATLEERRKTLERSLVEAKATQEALAKANVKAEEILAQARAQADESLAETKKTSVGIIADAEEAAAKRASLIIKEAESRLNQERDKLRQELRGELADLVAEATEKIIEQKLDSKNDMTLIERAIKAVAR